MDELLADFLTETTAILAELDVALLRMERVPDDRETLSHIFRLVHTIKGACGFLGLRRLERFTHAAETVLGQLRDAVPPPSPAVVSLVCAALDRMRAIIADLEATGKEPAGDDDALIAVLDEAADTSAGILPPAPVSVTTQAAYPPTGGMQLRMQPVSDAWKKLPALARDLERKLGKRIALTMHGGETELDGRILELVRDPLLHMVRNSADHGLEEPRDRLMAGKPGTGRIALDAFPEGGDIVIRVADDGNGLAMERIRRRAVAAGLVSAAELASMSDRQIQAFIFRPGFSTAPRLTRVSGRGVGMDVVRTNIERMGGTIHVESVPGAGTTFVMRIPLTAGVIGEAGSQRSAGAGIGLAGVLRPRPARLEPGLSFCTQRDCR